MFTNIEKQFMLSLAKRSIRHYLDTSQPFKIEAAELPSEKLKMEESCFVTLTMAGELRGCMGHVEAYQPLYIDIIENATAAAFDDPRFDPLNHQEFEQINVEISVLSKPTPLAFTTPGELIDRLQPGIDGVIIKKGEKGATYLPQVWEDFVKTEDLLSSLCRKAGLPEGDWRMSGLTVWTYRVEHFTENE
jgi:AmmeMemoRadiSam system protein A